ncbi:MAG: redoxin domain-containing protein [Sulfurovum sp.]|nr:redoxin domain-containing protein [Sulfurovum sp.]
MYDLSKSKPLLIHFWATWCPTCKLEASNIAFVSARYEVLSIAIDSGSDEVLRAYMQEHDLHFNVLNDQEGVWAKSFNVQVYPTTFIYDTQGELEFTEVGYTSIAGFMLRLSMLE